MNRLNLVSVIAALLFQAATAVAADPPVQRTPTATDPKPASAAPASQAATRLNLRLPDITSFLSQEQIDTVLSKTADRDTLEEVEVEGSRLRRVVPAATPEVWQGIASPVWAILHPLQAWRILAPIPPDRARYVGNYTPDATDSFRPVSLPDGVGSGF